MSCDQCHCSDCTRKRRGLAAALYQRWALMGMGTWDELDDEQKARWERVAREAEWCVDPHR